MTQPLGLLPELWTQFDGDYAAAVKRVELIERFDLNFLAPKLTPELTNGWLNERDAPLVIRDLKRYIALIVLFPGEALAPSNKIDMAWHTFILYTRPYREFCNEVFGHYVDHYPDPSGAPFNRPRYEKTLSRYRQAFGPPPDLMWNIYMKPAQPNQAPPARPVWPLAGLAVSLAVLGGVLLLPRAVR
jgi:hypothetical protein